MTGDIYCLQFLGGCQIYAITPTSVLLALLTKTEQKIKACAIQTVQVFIVLVSWHYKILIGISSVNLNRYN